MPDQEKSSVPDPARQNRQSNELEGILQTTNPKGWWAILFVTVSLAAVGVWACVVDVPQTTTSIGVTNAMVYSYQISAPAAGNVKIDNIRLADIKEESDIGTITGDDGKITKVRATKAGQIRALSATQNQYVQLGDPLLSIAIPAPADKPVQIMTFVGASKAPFYQPGETVKIQATDSASGRKVNTTATIVNVGTVPSTTETLNDTNGGVSGLTEVWMKESSGLPIPIFLQADDWPFGKKGFSPFGGLVVEITRTYETLKPIQRLFAGR